MPVKKKALVKKKVVKKSPEVAQPMALNGDKTVNVRKIENGYIIREEVYSKKSGYTSKETFSKTAPTITMKKG